MEAATLDVRGESPTGDDCYRGGHCWTTLQQKPTLLEMRAMLDNTEAPSVLVMIATEHHMLEVTEAENLPLMIGSTEDMLHVTVHKRDC